MIFLSVGTQFPFDRLVRAVDQALEKKVIADEVFAQIGSSQYRPKNFEAVQFLQKEDYDQWMQKASKIISHAGMGNIIAALDYQKPLLVMPRLSRYKEVVNDHQLTIAKRLEEQKCFLVAYTEKDIPQKLVELQSFIPQKRGSQVDKITARIEQFLDSLAHRTR